MKTVAWRGGYEGDELGLGVALAIALHAIPIVVIAIKAALPVQASVEEKPLIARPVVAASLLKLGRPRDPSKLPDRFVPRARTAPKHDLVASREDPLKKSPDAGAPLPLTQDSDLLNLITKSDPFAEDAGKARPDEGFANGLEAGTETDPNKVRAGDMYAAELKKFFGDRLQIPSVISDGETSRLCSVYRIAIGRNMKLFHIRAEPVRKSGNDLFDDSARAMLQKLLDDGTALPAPPPEVEELYKGRTADLSITGPHGDQSRCR